MSNRVRITFEVGGLADGNNDELKRDAWEHVQAIAENLDVSDLPLPPGDVRVLVEVLR